MHRSGLTCQDFQVLGWGQQSSRLRIVAQRGHAQRPGHPGTQTQARDRRCAYKGVAGRVGRKAVGSSSEVEGGGSIVDHPLGGGLTQIKSVQGLCD